jgi:hypothetical protein
MPTRKNKEIWKEIEKIIEEEIKKNNINEKELLTGIYYLNGNDGTTFDIAANERLSEIGKLYKNEYYAVKLFLQKNGDLKIFSYPNLENLQEHVKKVIPSFVSEEEFNEFASNIFEYIELPSKYDEIINPKIFETEYSDHSIEWEEEDFEEEDFEEEEEE